MYNDPIADLLTRIRNACGVGHTQVEIPASKLKVEIAKILLREGYIRSYELRDDKVKKFQTLRILLKYDATGNPVIRKIDRASKPGLRRYFRSKGIPRILGGAGTVILTTNKGLLTDRDARRDGIGGEALCYIE